MELLELLERPLLGSDGDALKNLSREMPEEFDVWFDAQIQSDKASSYIQNYKSLTHPLVKTTKPQVLKDLWKCVNLVGT